MRKQFTGYEWQTIKSQPSEWNQLQMFYRHWVCFSQQVLIMSATGRAFPRRREDVSSRGSGTNNNQSQPPCRLLAGSRCQRPHTFPRAKNPSREVPRAETLIMFQFKGAESCCGKLKLFIINDAYNK